MSTKDLYLLSGIVFTIGIIMLLQVYTLQESIPIKNLEKYLGETVMVEGKITNVTKTHRGDLKIKITDNTSYAWIVLYPVENISCNYIKVIGKVSEFLGEFYIFVYKKRDVIYCR